jgi:hypothetical protein
MATVWYNPTDITAGKILISDGTAMVSSTPTFPNVAGTIGNVLASDGTNFVSSAPIRASFLAYLTTTIPNITGDGTIFTCLLDTEAFDNGGNFDLATGTFTAPVTGIYRFEAGVTLSGGTSLSSPFIYLNTTSKSFRTGMATRGASIGVAQAVSSVTTNMTAGDTIFVQVSATDSGGKIDDLTGVVGANVQTWFSGTQYS